MKTSDRTTDIVYKGMKLTLSILLIIAAALGVMLAAFAAVQVTDYVITDGDYTVHIRAEMDELSTVLQKNGFSLINAEYTYEKRGDCIFVTITRKPMVTVVSADEELTAIVDEGTVGETLERLGIETSKNDLVSYGYAEKVFNGMVISVERVTYEYDTEEVVLPYKTEYVDDDKSYVGVDKVLTAGADGVRSITYESMYIDGVFADRSEYSISVEQEPVNEVISRGTKEVVYSEDASVTVDTEAKTLTTQDGEVLSYSKVLTMKATAYTYSSSGNITSSGVPVQVGVVAALPSTLPQGSRVYIVSPSGTWEYGMAVVGDKPGSDIIDLFMETRSECMQFGVREALVYVIE